MTITIGVAGVQHPHIDAILADITRFPELALVAVADGDARLRTSYAERYQLREYDDHTRLLNAEQIDALVVADVFSARARIVVDALNHGVHVLADKPLCTSLDDLDAIHTAWRHTDRLLSVAFEKRFVPPTLGLAAALDAGELGTITMVTSAGPHKLTRQQRPDWMFRADTYGGIINDLVVHDIDLLLHISGARSGTVRGYAGNRGHPELPEFEDHGLAVIDADDGPFASLDAHWFSPEAAPYFGDIKMCVVGRSGTADVLWKDDRLVVGTHDRAPAEADLPARGRAAHDFFDALRRGGQPAVTTADALAATSVALTAQESARRGETLTWNIAEYQQERA